MTYAVTGNTNAALVTTSVSAGVLTLGFVENGFGTATLTVEATSGSHAVTDTFTVTILNVDDPPTGSQENITVTEDAPNSVLPLASIFTDIDNPAADITVVATNDNPDLLTATVNGDNLTVAYHANQHGQAAITLGWNLWRPGE